jgi:ABC-type multidrug transport system fused ATPase/permease subunit
MDWIIKIWCNRGMDSKDKISSKKEIKRGIKAIRRHLKPYKKEIVILIVLGIISAVANGSIPYIIGKFFDSLVNIGSNKVLVFDIPLQAWAFFLILWSIAQIFTIFTTRFTNNVASTVMGKIELETQVKGFEHLYRLPIKYHKDAHINGKLQDISRASWKISGIVRIIVQLAPQLLSILIGVALASIINTTLAFILIFGVLIYLVALSRIILPAAALESKEHKLWNDGWDDAAAAVQQIESVKQAASEEYQSDKVRNILLGEVYKLWKKREYVWRDVEMFQMGIVLATQLVIFILSVRLIFLGEISIGGLIALNGYAGMLFGPFASLGYNWQTLQNGIISAAHAEDIFKEVEEKYNPEGAIKINEIKGKVEFKDVHFAYDENKSEVIKGVSFKAEPGQSIALVGESGVGKSTSISFISAYHFPTKGEVLIDGTSTRELDLINLRKHIAVVPQEVALFNDTIKTNIRYGSFGATDEDVEKVAKEVNIHKFISELPDGYNSLVGERGVKLSVGQKQRVSIARAMLRNPAILILDEPTSALDAQTERVVTEALEKLMKNRTTFIIAHRLSTVRKADRILVFEKGMITEEGTHEELIKKENGSYRKLYEYQVGLH